MSYYTIGDFSRKVGLSINTLRNWDKEGKLKPAYISSGGHRYYSDEQFNRLIGIKLDKQERITIGYARVSSSKQEDDLKRQVENIKIYKIYLPVVIVDHMGKKEYFMTKKEYKCWKENQQNVEEMIISEYQSIGNYVNEILTFASIPNP